MDMAPYGEARPCELDIPPVRAMVGICPALCPVNPPLACTHPHRHETSPALVVCHGFGDVSMRSRNRTRTYNLPVNSRLLCQLSYAGRSSRLVRAVFCGPCLVCVTRLAHLGL